MDAQQDRRWLIAPALTVNLAAAAMATAYAWLTLDLPPLQLTGLGLLFLVPLVLCELSGARRLVALESLASGQRVRLVEALVEVDAFPDSLTLVAGLGWVVAAGAAYLGLWAFTEAPTRTLLRILALCALFGPGSAILVSLLVLRRARRLSQAIAARVPSEDVIAAIPPAKLQLRTRLIGITCALALFPSLMLVDLAHQQTERRLSAVIAARGGALVQQRAAGEARAAVYGRLAMLFTLTLGAALLSAWASGEVLADPIRRVAEAANRMARGELGQPQIFPASDEAWAVTSTFSLLQVQLHRVVGQLSRAGTSLASTTSDLVGTSAGYAAGAAEQAASLNQTSATTEQLAQSARQISANAGEVAASSQRTLGSAQAGQASAEEFVRAVERMRQDNRSIAEAVGRLQRKVQQIGKIVEFITGVADRSDLLALSAELEGTKAGDVGRSFTLVAAEMRRLAENVLESTTEIEELIGEIREATRVTVLATEHGLEQTISGTALAGEVSRALVEVVRLAQETSGAVRGITLATQQQQSGTDQLAEAMTEILGVTQQSLAATKQLERVTQELTAVSGGLSELVGGWKR